ncbi:MAG: cupin domain-containing protein [Pseudomonadota bacterium]
MDKISLGEKFALFSETWTPKIVAQSNGQLVKLAKGAGELMWHTHENEDELFFVFHGELTIQLRDRNVVLGPGEMFVVPQGVEHCPLAEPNTQFMMIEPASTQHTGTHKTAITVDVAEQEWT